ncbi:MAG TPA: hypothetical protein VLW55_22390, partial [Burkholderiaceae bacterium]|nr:hypothetical protein [Burkholderiaceae bacterium]
RRVCSSAMSAANEASYAARPRTQQRSAVDAQHRPPQLSGLTGTACRDLVIIERPYFSSRLRRLTAWRRT